MEQFRIAGGKKLYGRVQIARAKNAVLPMMAAAILTDEPVVIRACPHITDVFAMAGILTYLGAVCEYREGDLILHPQGTQNKPLAQNLTGGLRSSVCMLGALLARFGSASIAFPGGCKIGTRPLDLHLGGLAAIGVHTHVDEGGLHSERTHSGGTVRFTFPSVGATENVLLAAALGEGETTIYNGAREPEVEDLARLLSAMGGDVKWKDGTYRIRGVRRLHGATFLPVADRIEAGTFLCMAASAGGEVQLDGVNEKFLTPLTEKIAGNGCKIYREYDRIIISRKDDLAAAGDVTTAPYPGFATDLQAQYAAVCATAKGTTNICESLFESRFAYAAELARMGADITVTHNTAHITGVPKLHGGTVFASDLRGGAALITAALGAEGETLVGGCKYVDRGYDNLVGKLRTLGADIRRLII